MFTTDACGVPWRRGWLQRKWRVEKSRMRRRPSNVAPYFIGLRAMRIQARYRFVWQRSR